jgi:hypothetical protein
MATQAPTRVALTVHGVGYGVATRYIEQELSRQPGVTRVQLTPSAAAARIVCEGTASPDALRTALRRLGFEATLN